MSANQEHLENLVYFYYKTKLNSLSVPDLLTFVHVNCMYSVVQFEVAPLLSETNCLSNQSACLYRSSHGRYSIKNCP